MRSLQKIPSLSLNVLRIGITTPIKFTFEWFKINGMWENRLNSENSDFSEMKKKTRVIICKESIFLQNHQSLKQHKSSRFTNKGIQMQMIDDRVGMEP